MKPRGFIKRREVLSGRVIRWTKLLLALFLAAPDTFSSSSTCLPEVISDDAGRFTVLLASPVPERRVEGVQGLANLKHWLAESAVLRLLEDASPAVRREAVLALGRLGGVQTIPRFIELLDDPSWEIRQNAWLGLGRMTAQDFAETSKTAWASWWAESTLAQKEQTLLRTAGGPPDTGVRGETNAAYIPAAPGRRGRPRASMLPPAHPERRDALRALVHLATPASEDALMRLLQQPRSPPLDADERGFLCEALERVGSPRAIPALASQRSDAAAWALGSLGGVEAERALLEFPRTLPTLLALDRLHSTNAGPFLPELVAQMGQITYRGQPDDVMNRDLQPIQRVGANLIRRSGLAPLFFECVLQELEDTMKPPVPHGARPAAPPGWDEMFKRMRSELKPGFVREDGTTTSQPVVAMCYLLDDGWLDGDARSNGGAPPSPSPLNGERAGVRGENVERAKQAEADGRNHPSPLIPLPEPSGVRPSSGAEISDGQTASERSQALVLSHLSAPEDGRTPVQGLKTRMLSRDSPPLGEENQSGSLSEDSSRC